VLLAQPLTIFLLSLVIFFLLTKNDLCQIQFKEDLGLLLAKKLLPLSFVEATFLKIE